MSGKIYVLLGLAILIIGNIVNMITFKDGTNPYLIPYLIATVSVILIGYGMGKVKRWKKKNE